MFKVDFLVTLPDTDAAGIFFFGNYFRRIHETYELFMKKIDFSLSDIIYHSDFFLLIAHAEATYKKSMRLGEKYSVNLKVEKAGRTSFVLKYEILNNFGEITTAIKTVHVAVDKKSNKKIKLPVDLHKQLLKYM